MPIRFLASLSGCMVGKRLRDKGGGGEKGMDKSQQEAINLTSSPILSLFLCQTVHPTQTHTPNPSPKGLQVLVLFQSLCDCGAACIADPVVLESDIHKQTENNKSWK